MIPITRLDLGPEEEAAVVGVLRSGMIGQGCKVAELEERWAAYCGVEHAVSMANGTVALAATLTGLGIGPGDEVITVSHTFNATVAAILLVGATPVFVDIEPDTFLMDAAQIVVTPRTRAIVPVSLFGLMADMDAIEDIASRHGLAVIEDACQAHGAVYKGRRAGSFGTGVFSLYGTKNMTTGEGGLVTTNDARLADWLRLYRNQGMSARYRHDILGTNLRMTDIAAAIGLVQLDKLDGHNAKRRAIASTYAAAGLFSQVTPPGRTHVYHQYTLNVGEGRDEIVTEMGRHGVTCGIYYPVPVHRQPYVVELGLTANLPVTDAVVASCLSLPVYPSLTPSEQGTVIRELRRALDKRCGLR